MTKKMTRREALKTLGLAIGTVTASSVHNGTAFQLFEKDSIESEPFQGMSDFAQLRHVHYADQGVQGFHTEVFVVVLHGIHIDYFLFHHSLGLWGKGINKTLIGKEPSEQRVIRV